VQLQAVQSCVGGPTLMTDQLLGGPLATRGWLAFPATNRLTMFDARYLHGEQLQARRLGCGEVHSWCAQVLQMAPCCKPWWHVHPQQYPHDVIDGMPLPPRCLLIVRHQCTAATAAAAATRGVAGAWALACC
jgi:hypothetical protein